MEQKKKFTCIAVRWFDKANGNTYHSCRITRHRDGVTIGCVMQYGYGDHYRQTALKKMLDAGWVTGYGEHDLYSYERENDCPILWYVSEGTKRDCIQNGVVE